MGKTDGLSSLLFEDESVSRDYGPEHSFDLRKAALLRRLNDYYGDTPRNSPLAAFGEFALGEEKLIEIFKEKTGLPTEVGQFVYTLDTHAPRDSQEISLQIISEIEPVDYHDLGREWEMQIVDAICWAVQRNCPSVMENNREVVKEMVGQLRKGEKLDGGVKKKLSPHSRNSQLAKLVDALSAAARIANPQDAPELDRSRRINLAGRYIGMGSQTGPSLAESTSRSGLFLVAAMRRINIGVELVFPWD